MGITQAVARAHGYAGAMQALPRAVAEGESITAAVRAAGFQYVTLDLAGFRSGSMNEALRANDPGTH